MRFYSIKNYVSNTFNTPFREENDANALYAVRMMVNQQRDPGIIADDFGLYYVGEFDPEIGMFTSDESPCCLCGDLSMLLVKKREV